MSLLHFKLVGAEKIGHVGRFSSPRRPNRRLPPARVSGDPPVPPGPPAAGGQFLLQPLSLIVLIRLDPNLEGELGMHGDCHHRSMRESFSAPSSDRVVEVGFESR